MTDPARPRALITASTSGIGRAIAEELSADGYEVTVHGRSEQSARTAAEAIGGDARALWGDVGDPAALAHLAHQVRESSHDVLVAAAGPYAERTVDDAEPADWLDTYRLNVVSSVELARAALPGMRERGFGRVVFLGTRGTRTPIPTMIDYSAAKAALANATISLARSATGPGVTVNMVSPGVILTPAFRQMLADRPGAAPDFDERAVTEQYAPNPQDRLGRAEDIAALVAFLVGDRAGYLNGADIPVDGGITGTR